MHTKCSTATWWTEERRLLNKGAIKNTNKTFLEYHLLPLAFTCMEEWILKFLDPKAKALESPLDCKKIQPVHPKGDQTWVFTGSTDAEAETPILWPSDVKN